MNSRLRVLATGSDERQPFHRRRERSFRSMVVLSVMPFALFACGGDDVIEQAPLSRPAAAAPPPAPAPAASVSPDDGLAALPVREFQEADFQETDRSRDPFRSFEHLFVHQAKVQQPLQRQVLVDRYALDELRLVGVISRGAPRALLVDPVGTGWSAKVGDFVGKAEIVHAGGPTGTDVAVNWRVDRVRESDVVFIREDTSHPEIPPTTRVLALYPEGEQNSPNR